MVLATADYVIIVLFLVTSLGVGLWFSRRWRGSEDFFLAGRSLTWPLIGVSLFATNISAEHFVGMAAAGHRDGLAQGGYEWIASYCCIMLAVVFAPQYLRHRVFTIPEFFEKRYGVEARVALTIYFLVMIVVTKLAVAIYAGSRVVHHFVPQFDLDLIMWAVGIFTALYTMAGGLSAVIYTDFLQAIVLIAGSVMLTWSGLEAVGGWEALQDKLAASGRGSMLSMVRPSDDPELPFSGFLLGNFLVGGMFYWCMDQVNVQRVLGAKSLAHARGGAILAGFLKIIPVFILVLPGVIAAVVFDSETITHHDDTYGVLVGRLLGPGTRGFVLAALLAALMSSLSSVFNSSSTIVARDLVQRFWPRSSQRTQIFWGQVGLVTVLVGGISIAASGVIEKFPDLWNYLQDVTSYLSAPFAVAGLLGIFSRRINRQGALAGLAVGVATGVCLFIDSKLEQPLLSHPYLRSYLHRSFLAGVAAAVTMIAVSAMTPPPPKEVVEGSFSLFRRKGADAEPRPRSFISDWRVWTVALFSIVTWLWWTFR